MWLFTNRGFLSIVRHSDKPGVLVVRSRFPGHIQSVFPKAHVTENPSGDYRFRSEIPAKQVADRLAAEILSINYENFKDSVGTQDYLACCIDVYYTVKGYSEPSTYDWTEEDFG